MKQLVWICRIVVGVIFILSGFVKLVDPIGFSYKLEEYFSPEVFDVPFLYDLALPMATLFCALEIMLGIFLLLGIFKKFTTWCLLGLILFFTFLTFYSAYFNKVTDCGCFGDALKLTPWQSFYKDLFLLILILIILMGQKYIEPVLKKEKGNFIIIGISLIACIWIAIMGIFYLPILDFRAYAVSKNLTEGMKSAQELGKKPPTYQVNYTMKNKTTGEKIVISDKEYLNNDKWYKEGTPWELQSDLTETIKLSDGYEPPIHDFMLDCDGEDKTEFYLSQPKVVFMVAPFSENLTEAEIKSLNQLFTDLQAHKIEVVGLTNGDVDGAKFPYCLVDQITLKTMTRNNPGIIALHKGTVVAKFHDNPIPGASKLMKSFQ